MSIPFKKIQFGFSSAEEESTESPKLLTDAFLDLDGIIEELVYGNKCLILGRKGSGKSAIGQHLMLTGKEDSGVFIKTLFLSDLSYISLKSIIRAEIEDALIYPKAWSWILLLCLLDSLSKDQGAAFADENQFLNTMKYLKSAGLMPVQALGDTLSKTGVSFEVSGWGIKLGGSSESPSEKDVTVVALTEHLKNILINSRTESRHILIIDGLDDILLSSGSQFEAISGLIQEAVRLNQEISKAGLNFKIVILCRTDIFERLPGANINKTRQDKSVQIKWYDESRYPEQSPLVQLVNQRAQLSDPTIRDMFSTYFPQRIRDKRTIGYLLDFTRYTPRDFILLLKYIQRYSLDSDILQGVINNGIRAYAEEYLLPEVRDELDPEVPRDYFDDFMDLLRQFRRSSFSEKELRDFAKTRGFDQSIIHIGHMLKRLYDCGAIGNSFKVDTNEGRQTKTKYVYKFRRPTTSYNPSDTIVIQQGMCFALSLR